MSEWSKEVDLRPTVYEREGSNPSPPKFFINVYILAQYANAAG